MNGRAQRSLGCRTRVSDQGLYFRLLDSPTGGISPELMPVADGI